MKSIKEKELLVNFAKSLGQEVDPTLVEEVEQINSIRAKVKSSVHENVLSDLFKALADIPKQKPILDKPVLVEEEYYPKPPSLDELMQLLEEEVKDELVQTHSTEESPVAEEALPDPTPVPDIREETLADKAAKLISEAPKSSYQQPDPIVVPENLDAIKSKLKFLEQWLAKVSLAGPGGGASDSTTLTNFTTLVTGPTYAVRKKDYYIGVNYSGNVTITLPAFQVTAGRKLIIKDESGNSYINPITVVGNVDNDAGGFILKMDNGAIQMIYRDGWRII